MRFLSRLVWLVGLLAVVALAACSGEDDDAAPAAAQTTQQSAAQTDQTAEAARGGDAAERAEAEAAQSEQGEPSAEGQSQGEQAQAQTTEQGTVADGPNAAAQAALEDWSATLSTAEMTVEIEVESDFFDFSTVTQVALQLEPLTIWVQLELPEELAAMFGDDALQMLLAEDGVYLSMEQFEGWVDFGAVAGVDIMALLGTTGFDPNSLTNLEQLAAPFTCLNTAGGEVSEDTFEGRPVWLLDCNIDPESMAEVADEIANSGLGLPGGGVDIVAMRVIMAIDRESGAPLLTDSDITVADPQSGAESQVRSIARLLSWNEPLEFPVPEPLVDPSVLEMLGGPVTNGDAAAQPGSDAFSPEAQFELVEAWFAAEDALALEIESEATIAGQPQSAYTIVLRSFSDGKYETSTTLNQGVRIRFLWTRDGLWLSEADDPESGAPQWIATNPALLGLENQTIDEFLAGQGRIEFGALGRLLESAYIERTEDASGVRYRVVFERGGIVPGDELHSAAAEFLRAESAELLVEDVEIGEIYGLSVTFDLIGENGAFEQSDVWAEFETELGLVALRSTVRNISEGVWAFSTP